MTKNFFIKLLIREGKVFLQSENSWLISKWQAFALTQVSNASKNLRPHAKVLPPIFYPIHTAMTALMLQIFVGVFTSSGLQNKANSAIYQI